MAALRHRGRGLGTHALPVAQAVHGYAQAFLAGCCQRVVKTDALNKPAVTAVALVSDDDVEKRAMLGAATGESNHDHDLSFGWRGDKPRKSRSV